MQGQWFATIDKLITHMISLQSENEILLNKFKTNANSLEEILNDQSITTQNLARHKILIKDIIGKYNAEENKRIQIETQKETLSKEIKFWIEDWDIIHTSPLIIVQ